ncbi:Ulp1 protease family C-terminal catalytic domain [Arabidopsis suecica]|uniref:Ulp1 protease family C-terminal catalytic domain n=1 Tax=Arabidopsis suecica TaxID=45249 RepID=A0A8T2BSI1_ARASU|nr:Ulp1 protease family C-terminal catalytic domain [Arabidopsis suecica]
MANPLLPMRLFKEGAEPNEGPAYSGKLIHFLLSRQLVVNKENEIWVVFAGSPLRFSISEFQRMTGLSCNKSPQSKARKSKRKLLLGKYWYTLFDRADVSVEWVVGRLKKRLVPDKEIRLRYAILALIDGVLCPTSGKPKISPIHADMSENLEKFLNHPWGTTSFQLTLKSIKARGAEKLKRKSVTVQGFPHALQLLLLHSVPIIRELQFPDPDLEVDGDSEIEEIDTEIERLWSLKLDIVWKMANPLLPMRLFREGAEPNGERVQSYSELPFIDEIANSLDAEDIQFLRDSQLVVNKENEIWVVFAGSPLRFSISEFQRMTGLNCNKPPQSKARKSKRKLLPGKYWYTLFDRADVSVEWVVGRLKKRLVPDKEIRLRYAILALIDGVLCPTSGKPKISPIHADIKGSREAKAKVRDWPRIPSCPQLLLLHSVPIIKELQFPDPDLEVDGDSEIEEIDTEIERLWSLKLDIVWKTNVVSILSGEVNGDPLGSASWVEDRDDVAVDQMIQLIGRRDKFTASMFGGGLLPDSLPDDKNDNIDVCSTHDSLDEVNGPKRKRKGKANVQISEAMKQYVDMKEKQSENRMLKAISESEGRLTKLIMKAISSPKQGTTNLPSEVCGHVGRSEKVVSSGEEEVSGQEEGGKENPSNVDHTAASGSKSGEAYGTEFLEHVLESVLPEINVAAVELPVAAVELPDPTWHRPFKKTRRNSRTTTIAPPKRQAEKPSLETIIENEISKTVPEDGKRYPASLDGVSSPTYFEVGDVGNTDTSEKLNELSEALHTEENELNAAEKLNATEEKKRKRGKPKTVSSRADETVCVDLIVHGAGIGAQTEDETQQDPDEPAATAKNIDPETDLHRPDAFEDSLDTLHPETNLAAKAVNADSAAFVEEDLGDESMLLENEACCGLLPEENLLNPLEPSPESPAPPPPPPQLPPPMNRSLSFYRTKLLELSFRGKNKEVLSKGNSPNPLQTSELPSDTVAAPCTNSRTVTFGHDVGRVNKISRITSMAGEINFGTDRTLSSTELRDIVHLKAIVPQLVMDIFINSIRIDWQAKTSILKHQDVAFIDSTFVYELFKHYPNFSKTTEKGMYEFDHDLLECTPIGFERVYLPFLCDKQHWVGLIVDIKDWKMTGLDCFTGLWREPKLKNVLLPLAEMLPYLFRFVSNKGGEKKRYIKPFVVHREKEIPQAAFVRHSGVMAAQLIEAHAHGGIEACKRVKLVDVFSAAKNYMIAAYELANGII